MSGLRVLAVVDHYLPGYRFGGPVRTLANIAEALGSKLQLRILTSDRDLGDEAAYPGVPRDAWTRVGGAAVRYLSPRECSALRLAALLRRERFDLLYLNSVFSPFTRRILLLRRLRLLPPVPVLLAPRGELGAGALRLKRAKKAAYLLVARGCGLYGRLAWQASSEGEAEEVRRVFGRGVRTAVARDLAVVRAAPGLPRRPPKAPGAARFVFLSRISPKKNLLGALDALAKVRGEAELDIFGPAEEAGYWRRCLARIAALPANVRCRVHGAVPPAEVDGALAGGHFLLFPTFHENFGHVIVEALRVGTPVITGDQTPWPGLEAGRAGWTVAVDSPAALLRVVQRCMDMEAGEYDAWSAGAAAFLRDSIAPENDRERQLAAFELAAGRDPRGPESVRSVGCRAPSGSV